MAKLTIATWNVNSLRIRLPQVVTFLTESRPDVLALQETKVVDKDFPYQAFEEIGYFVIASGQPSYNGVAMLCRQPLTDIVKALPHIQNEERRLLAVSMKDIRIINLYVPNGKSVDSEKYQYKLSWLRHLLHFLNEEQKKYKDIVVLGDFNIAPEDRDIHDPLQFAGKLLCSPLEREAFSHLLQIGLQDCFRLHTAENHHFTWWDYRQNAFKRKQGWRIDHILASQSLLPHCDACTIDTRWRAQERPSDHAPVIVTLKV